MPDYRASWYSQLPAFGWFDREDRPGSNALGVPDSQQGIALPSRRTLGQWFNVTSPTGQTYKLQQTDVGPANWTGRGVDISAAAAHQMGYTPKTFPTDASFRVEPTDGSEMPPNASLTQGRSMPSLMDLYNPPQQSGWDRLTGGGASNALIGAGLGLLQPRRPWESPYAGMLQGYTAGAQADELSAQRQAQNRRADIGLALQLEQSRRAGQSEFEKIQQDIQKYGPAAEKFYASKTEGDWALADIGQDQWGQPIKKWVNKRTMETRDVQPGDAVAGNAPFAAGGAVPYVGGGPMGAGTQAPTAPAPTPSTAARTPMVQLPSGQVIPIPPGMDAKKFREHVTTAAADAASGKMTEEQSKSNTFASRMENAENIMGVKGIEQQGLDTRGHALDNYVPGIIGHRLLTPEYQRFSNAKSQFITGLLRRESGAAISAYEWQRYGNEYFPVPGDSPQQIEDKRRARAIAIESMKKSAGPSYTSPEPPPQNAPTASTTRTGGAAVPTYNLQTGKFE